jgi:catechol 2,3-dioxygenase-like lactoylglutathione lyase family enzyme
MSPAPLSSADVLLQVADPEQAAAFRLFLERGPSYGPVFEFFVGDLAAAKHQLTRAGCHIDQDDPGVPKCYVRDPFGLTFNIAVRR